MPPEKQSELIGSPEYSPFEVSLKEALQVFYSLSSLEDVLRRAAECCAGSLREGHKLLVCGNGGSACEAQHLVGELMGRYKSDRMALAAIAMTADSAVLTCIGNDYCFEDIFARQLQALGQAGDILVVFTTGGYSPNILRALEAARSLKLMSIAFLGRDGGAARSLTDCALIVPHADTARVQEGHQFLLHSLMDSIETIIALES
ncbi:MAG TPA: SIS domain-containing protein [Acidobacteriaceae bacterium]